jgi:hypothetical protein
MGGTPNTPAAGHLLAATVSSGVHATGDWISQVNSGKLDSNIKAIARRSPSRRSSSSGRSSTAVGNRRATTRPQTSSRRGGTSPDLRSESEHHPLLGPNVYVFGVADPENHYPGADVVDWVAFDGYCHGSYHTFDQIFAKAIHDYGPNGTRHKHPFMVGETAAQKR